MCRLVAYLGHELLMEEILVKPTNSIVSQSLHARETKYPTNGDGFGLGWYTPSINADAALFASTLPAWNDQNLRHLTAKIKSNCFFAHVRAASVGGVNYYNCHPFAHGAWMLMHNGSIANFIAVKRHLRRLLDDDIYNWIKGETDSEHFFALFLQIAKNRSLKETSVVVETLRETIQTINQLVKTYGEGHEASYFNICISDGKRIFATRYCSDPKLQPETLHYFSGRVVGNYPLLEKLHKHSKRLSVVIASEKLTDFKVEWLSVPKNNLLIAHADWHISLEAI